MKVELKKLINILESKSNRAINMLDEIKCTTPEFKNILDSVLNNLNALKQIQAYDIDCPDCKTKEEVKPQEPKTTEQPKANERKEAPVSNAIGKKWEPFKGGK